MRVLPFLVGCLLAFAGAAPADTPREWSFRVLLDGSPIGTQVFRLSPDGNRSRVSIDASFDVKILSFTVYSYRHRNEEVWEDGCLRSMQSTTDDNGDKFRVSATATGDAVVVETAKGTQTLPACVTSFAYWDPDALRASQLLNSQTGDYEPVTLRELGMKTIPLRGQPTPARHVVLEGDKIRIELWYSETKDWLALESTTTSGRKLTYTRL